MGRFGQLAPSIAELLSETEKLTTVDGKFYFFRGPQSGSAIQPATHERRHIHDCSQKGKTPARYAGSVAAADPAIPTQSLSNENRYYAATTCWKQGFEVIANVDEISAPELVYPEAVYLHNGDSYFVRELDFGGESCLCRAARNGLLHTSHLGK